MLRILRLNSLMAFGCGKTEYKRTNSSLCSSDSVRFYSKPHSKAINEFFRLRIKRIKHPPCNAFYGSF